jgi:hypothetical protein
MALALMLAALVGASCTSTPATGPGGSTTATAASGGPTSTGPTGSTSTTRPPSALDDLTTFFTAAAGVDQKLRAAAVDANGSIGTTEITISQSTLDAIAAADPTSVGSDIPAGLPPAVLLPVLTVQSDLVSRYFAFRGFVEARVGTIPRANPTPGTLSAAQYLLTCLGSGAPAASSFAADVAAARTAASGVAPVAAVDPASRQAADLAIWLQHIVGLNSGCEQCGGERYTVLEPITWHQVAPLTPGGNAWDGDLGGLLFTARYAVGQGWDVEFNAC